jgi:hypothetical protein
MGREFETVTTDPTSGLYVGLHVDDWYHLPFGFRAEAPSRLCANFGWSDRFFLFLNLSVDSLFKGEIGEFADWSNEQKKSKSLFLRGPTSLGRGFLHAYPDYPILRLRVRPGEAYVAPTENIVHDGGWHSSAAVDVSCHVHG